MRRLLLSGVAVFALGACASNDATDGLGLAADTVSLPETEIFLAPLSFDRDMPVVGELRNISQHTGYDNQPSFLPGAAAFYYVSEGASGKTDVWRYDIAEDDNTRVYASSGVSEYSPKAAPGDYGVSYIQENQAADITRVHVMPASGGAGAPVIELAPLGYYAWLRDGEKLGVYLRSDPAALHLVDIESGQSEMIAENIGRSLHATPDGRGLYFTRADADEIHSVMYFDLNTDAVTTIADLPAGAEDFTVFFTGPNEVGGLLAGDGSTLLFNALESEMAEWREVGDYAARRLNNITRIAISDDHAWIALVAQSQ
ncbi:MAG: hypothetical protein AAF936_10090 [Pseudomonadota bacterium]